MAEPQKIWLTRPEEDSTHLAAQLAPRVCIVAPIMQIETVPIDWPTTPPDAVLITSRHAAAALANTPATWRDAPVYCVSHATAQAANKAGFTHVQVGSGDLLGLMPQLGALQAGTQLYYIAGKHQRHSIADLLDGRHIHTTILEVYDAKAATTPPMHIRKALASGDVNAAVFFSPRSAKIACQLVAKAGLSDAVKNVDAYCLSLAVAQEAGALTWKSLQVCHVPTQEAMVELVVSRHPANLL